MKRPVIERVFAVLLSTLFFTLDISLLNTFTLKTQAAETPQSTTDGNVAAPSSINTAVVDTTRFISAVLTAIGSDPGYSGRIFTFIVPDEKLVEVREYGNFVFGTHVYPGDSLGLSIEIGAVNYYKNNLLIFTSKFSPTIPLYLNPAMLDARPGARFAYFFQAPQALQPCGVNNNLPIIPFDYNLFSPPQKGDMYRDPGFGCEVRRLTAGVEDYGSPAHHEYSSMNPFNADNTRILGLLNSGAFFIMDKRGNEIVSGAKLGILGNQEPRWSPHNPNLLFFHERNQIIKYDLGTSTFSTVHVFQNYTTINFGGGEGDISEDGDHIVVIGNNRFVQVYEFSTDTVSPVFDTGANGYDWFDMTPDNNVLGLWYARGAGRYRGLELFDRNMQFLRQVIPWTGHADRGRDINGDEIIAIIASNDPFPALGCEENGVEKIRLFDSQKTCIFPLYWGEGAHISINNVHGHPWMLVSNTSYFDSVSAPSEWLPANWMDRWGTYVNEIDLVKLDGSIVWRLAHHRSRALDSYYHMPRAALSGDGSYVLFDSNFDLSPRRDYTDIYMIPIYRLSP
jgi:hypothetical protein